MLQLLTSLWLLPLYVCAYEGLPFLTEDLVVFVLFINIFTPNFVHAISLKLFYGSIENEFYVFEMFVVITSGPDLGFVLHYWRYFLELA